MRIDKKQTSKNAYRHIETGDVIVIEKRWDGAIIGSAGPLSEPLRSLDSYECTDKNNVWLMDNSDKLILYESEDD